MQAANQQDLKTALIGLAEDKGVALTDEERKDPEQAYRKVRAAFEQGEASLILFDNVDHATLLAPHQVAHLLPTADHVHVMVTTRLPAGQFGGAEVISVQELPEENALRLLDHHRPFAEEAVPTAAKAAATEIARLLQGYTLAVEVVGVFLWKNPEVSYPQYLEQLRKMDIQTLDISGIQDEVQLSRHQEKVISRLIAPTLEQLSETEQQAIKYAALLPPDQVALPWLKDLVAKDKENTLQTNGVLDPWQRLVRRVKGLGIFTETQEANIVRMHRILQAVVQNRWKLEDHQEHLSVYIKQQAERMTEQWHDKEQQWTIAPLISYCEDKLLKSSEEGVDLANYVFQLPLQLGRYAEALHLAQKATQLAEKVYQPPHPSLGNCYSNLAIIEQDLGNFAAAKKWMLKAIVENDEKVYQAPHSSLGIRYSNLALIERDMGNYSEAMKWMLKAIKENDEIVYQPPHPSLGTLYSNLARIEKDRGNYTEARKWMIKAIEENDEKIYQPPHPSLGRRYSNLALIEKAIGNYAEARKWMIKAIEENHEKVYQPPHPSLGTGYSNLGIIEQDLGNYAEARKWMLKAIEDNDEKVYQPPHPYLGGRYSNLALIEQDLGNYGEARKWMLKAIGENDEKVYQPPHPSLGTSYSNLAQIEKDLGNYAEARKWMLKAIEENDEKIYQSPHPSLGTDYSNLATIEKALGNYEAARGWMLKAIKENFEKVYRPPHPDLGKSYSNLAMIAKGLGNYAEAGKWMLNAIFENYLKLYEPPHPQLGITSYHLAQIEYVLGNTEAACMGMKFSYENYKGCFGEDHQDTKHVESWLQSWGC